MKKKTRITKQLLSILLCLALILTYVPTLTVAMAADAKAGNMPEAKDGRFYGKGTHLYIAEGTTSGKTVVYYLSDGNKVYLNASGAAGDDLSEAYVYGGDYAAQVKDTYVTMLGGTVADIRGDAYSEYYSTDVTGNVNITVSGGTVNNICTTFNSTVHGNSNITITGGNIGDVHCGAAEISVHVKGNVNLVIRGGTVENVYGDLAAFPIDGTTSAYITNGTIQTDPAGIKSQFDNLIYKNGTSWTILGNPTVPVDATMTINSGETVTVPEGRVITNSGSIVNNGTMNLYGYITGNAITGTGTVNRYAAYISGVTDADNVSVQMNGVDYDGYYSEVADNALWLWLPTGSAKVQVGNQYYYGETKKGTKSELKEYSGVYDITGIPTAIGANREINLEPIITAEGQSPALTQTISYEILSSTAAEASITGNVLKAASGGEIKLKVTAKDAYFSFSKEFTISVNYTSIQDFVLPSYAYVNQQIQPPAEALENASYTDIQWQVLSGEASIQNGVILPTKGGQLKLRATLENGVVYGQTYTKEFTIQVQAITGNELDIGVGNIVIKEENNKLRVTYSGYEGGYQLFDKDAYIAVTGTTNVNCIIIESGAPNLILKDCTINTTSNYPIYVEYKASLNLILEGTNKLAFASGYAFSAGSSLNVSIGGGGTLSISGNRGILGGNLLTIGGNAKVTIETQKNTITGDNITIADNAVVTASSAGSWSIEAKTNMNITGGTVVATGESYGIIVGGEVSVTGGVLTATGDSYGISARKGSISISGGTVSAEQIGTDTVSITGGNVWSVFVNKYGREFTPTDGSQSLAYKTITLSGAADLTAVQQATGLTYGLNDVKTLGDKLYFYLPSDATLPTSITAGGTTYYRSGTTTTYVAHQHSFTYEKEGDNKIVATCNVSNCPLTDGYGGSVTLSAQDVTYDGMSHNATTTGSFTEGTPTISYQYKATADGEYGDAGDLDNAGYYKAAMKMGEAEVSVEFEIKKLAVTITAKDQSIIYGGSIKNDTAQVTVGTLAAGDAVFYITLTPSTENVPGGTITPSNAVIKAGEEDVTANYKITYENGELTINPADMTVTAEGYEGTYDGAAHGIEVIAPDGAKVEYSTDGTNWSESNPQFTNVADSTTVSYRVTKDNYETVTGSAVVKIDPIEITVTVDPIADQTYNGDSITPAVTVTDKDSKLVEGDTLVKGTDYTVSFSKNNTNVGTVTVTISDVAGGNYTVSGSGSFKIVQAENEWTVTPSISGWIYGETSNAPIGEAKFGTVTVTYSGTANDGTVYTDSTTAPNKAGSYTATFTVAGADNYSGLTKENVTFTIGKADYDMTNARWDYDSAFQYDGKAHTVTVTGLPSSVTVKVYTGNSASVVGSYTAKVTFTYDEDNYNAPALADLVWAIKNNWNPNEYITSGSGWQNTDFVITAKDGYKLSTTNTADGTWVDSLTGSTEGENSITFYVKNETTDAISLAKIESYKLDKTAPTGTVSIDENKWNDLWNTISFDLFFKETKTVKVEVATDLSGIAKAEYYDSAVALTAEEVKAITAWTDMGADYAQDVTAQDAKTFIYYIRITDNAGNVAYISTADATYDLTKPAISGITNGSTYYTTQKVTVSDTNLATVTLNGDAVTGEITLAGNIDKTYTIVATDKAGNETTCTVTMKAIASISAPIDSIDESNVNSGNTDVIAEVEATAAALDTTNATDAEKAAIKAITDKCAALQEVIADTAAEYERITDAIAAYDPDEVTSADKAALDKLAEDLEALAESGNLTESERTALETPAENLDAMIETVNEVTEESDRIADAVGDYALETVKSSDKDEIEQLVEDIDALLDTDNLTDEERTALESEKTKCENLLAKIEGTDALVDKLTEDVGAYDEDTVKSTDKAALEQLVEDIEAVIEGNTNITEKEKTELEALVDTVEDLLTKIEEVAQAPVTEDTEKVEDITSENVTPEDKEDLTNAKADLEDALTENAGNYTEDERKAIQEEIDRIDDALEAIENVESVEETISELPAIDTVKPDDEDAIKAITDAKAEYDALTDHEKSQVSEDTKKKLDDLCAALVAYDIIEGENGKYTQGGSKGLSFTANGAYSKFSGILVDNKAVDPEHYTAESGSTVITLKESYLDTLSIGKHTLTVVYTDGETSCEFTIAAKSTTPATGDNSHMMLWFSLMIVSCAAILVLLNYKRFFTYGGKYSK